jgi:hypothetical protein
MTSNTSYTVYVEQDPESGELVLPFPEGLLDQMGWKIGDNIRWTENKDGTWSLTKAMAMGEKDDKDPNAV